MQSLPPKRPSPDRYLALGRTSVLVLDDNANALTLIAEVLRGLGCGKVYRVMNAEAAMAQLNSGSVDLVFADIEMPDGNGLEFVRQVRASSNPAVAGVVIVMVSAQATESRVMEAGVSGADSFLGKPYSVSGLARCLGEGIAGRRWAEQADPPRRREPKVLEA